MSNTINHEAFMADAYQHLKALSELVQLYGYGDFVYATFSADGYIHIDCYNKGLEYSELPVAKDALYKNFCGKEEVA